MDSQTKICQNCKKEFIIEPEDFAFYQKIQVPAPTWCPECRLQRRMAFKNERTFYRRKCGLCNRNVISIFPENSPFPVFCPPCWWSDKWETTDYGVAYDFSKPFFIQFYRLLEKVPRISLHIDYPRTINSEYVHMTGPMKNCYLVIQAENDENCYYSYNIVHSKDSIDCFNGFYITNSYESIDCERCDRVFFSVNCRNSIEIYFSKNLRNCMYCFGCINLRNKKYHISNKPYSKEEYLQFIKNFNLGSYQELKRQKEKVQKFSLNFPNKYLEGVHNINVSGNHIYNSKNVFYSFDVIGAENCKYCRQLNMPGARDCWDYGDWGNNAFLVYESINTGEQITNVKFSYGPYVGENISYCDTTFSSSNIFGCISFKKKSYCILNKQYTKEEYERLVPKIIEHMNEMPYVDKKGRVYKYGEFFPPELSPFCYNETIAQEYFPLTKEQAIKQGYSWKDPEERDIKVDIKSEDLPDHIKDVKDDILGKVIECQHQDKCNEQCTTAFKLIEPELQFYRRMNLPLPRLCPNCRHYQRLKQRNPLKLWHRKCQCAGTQSDNGIYKNTIKHFHGNQPCPNEFETSYASDRKEIVYCEKCYLAEVV